MSWKAAKDIRKYVTTAVIYCVILKRKGKKNIKFSLKMLSRDPRPALARVWSKTVVASYRLLTCG